MLDPRTCKSLFIYGGTFDPPHRAHIELPHAALRETGTDGVLYIPAGQPPHKPDQPITPPEHRLAMLKLALSQSNHASICTWELDHKMPSYTVDTLEYLRNELGPEVQMHLLIGSDMAAIFDTWKSPARILELAPPRVMLREGSDRSTLSERWQKRIIPVPRIDISSSEIRTCLRAQKWDDPSILHAIAPDVLEYARENHLY